MSWKEIWQNSLKFVLFVGFGCTVLYLLYQQQSAAYAVYCAEEGIAAADCSLWNKLVGDFRSANYFWLFVVMLAFLVSNISRSARWMLLLRPLGYAVRPLNAFFTIMLGYFANLGFPRIGEFVRVGTLARYESIPAEKVMGTVVLDRMVDVLSLLTVIGLAFLLEYDTLWGYLSENATIAPLFDKLQSLLWLGFGLGAVILGLGYVFRARILESALAQRLKGIFVGFWEGLQAIRQVERPVWFFLHSVNIWLMYYLMTYLAFFSFVPTAELTPVAGLLVFVFGSFGMVLPSPGGMGAYQGLITAGLILYGVEQSDGFSFANIVFFSIQIGCNLLFGILALLLLPLLNGQKSVPTAT